MACANIVLGARLRGGGVGGGGASRTVEGPQEGVGEQKRPGEDGRILGGRVRVGACKRDNARGHERV